MRSAGDYSKTAAGRRLFLAFVPSRLAAHVTISEYCFPPLAPFETWLLLYSSDEKRQIPRDEIFAFSFPSEVTAV